MLLFDVNHIDKPIRGSAKQRAALVSGKSCTTWLLGTILLLVEGTMISLRHHRVSAPPVS